MNAPLHRPTAPARAACSTGGGWLAPLPGHWTEAAVTMLARQPVVVRVTVIASRGSAPREPGASMLQGTLGTVGTIGGGHLEYHAMQAASALLLARHTPPVRIEELVLGPDLGQCCGGRVELWLERLTRADLVWLREAAHGVRERECGVTLVTDFEGGNTTHRVRRAPPGAQDLAQGLTSGSRLEGSRLEGSRLEGSRLAVLRLQRTAPDAATLFEQCVRERPPLWVFGAGHVGQALVKMLGMLSQFEVTWVDSRPELLPAGLPECIVTEASATPADCVAAAPAGTRYVVMTHDHGLDFEVCHRVLLRGDSAWLGLIGSASKAARFRSRLIRAGIDRDALAALNCPIGIDGIASKHPAAISIAIAAQLLQQAATAPATPPAPAASAASAAAASPSMPACTGACSACGAAHPEAARPAVEHPKTHA